MVLYHFVPAAKLKKNFYEITIRPTRNLSLIFSRIGTEDASKAPGETDRADCATNTDACAADPNTDDFRC
jgi:hypothetical protein